MVPNHTAYSKLYPKTSSISAEDRNRTCVLLVQSQVQRPTVAASVKRKLSTPSGNRTRSAGFKGPRRVYAPERNCSHESSGGWTRTITRLLNREPPYRLGHTGLLFTKVRTTGFEPAISCTRSTRNTKLSHILIIGLSGSAGADAQRLRVTANTERPVGVEPTLPPWQGSRLPLHHGRICITTKLSKIG